MFLHQPRRHTANSRLAIFTPQRCASPAPSLPYLLDARGYKIYIFVYVYYLQKEKNIIIIIITWHSLQETLTNRCAMIRIAGVRVPSLHLPVFLVRHRIKLLTIDIRQQINGTRKCWGCVVWWPRGVRCRPPYKNRSPVAWRAHTLPLRRSPSWWRCWGSGELVAW